MKLSEFTKKPLLEALADMNLVTSRVFTDDDGNVEGVELHYKPYKETAALKENNVRRNGLRG